MLQKIEGCSVTTALPTEHILENIRKTKARNLPQAHKLGDWRKEKPIALVGGGPSLKDTYDKLAFYQFVMVCGSAHDYLVSKNIPVDYAVICDPDPLVINYLQYKKDNIRYLLASQCAPETFDHLKENNVAVWHAGGENVDYKFFGEDTIAIGGGCTVGTRALMLAMAFGFNNFHLYGFDNCLTNDYKHHAYDFHDPEKETIGNITEVQYEEGGPKFKVAGYMLAQLFDFQRLLDIHGNTIKIEVFGGGLLSALFDLAKKKVMEIKNGS